MQIWVGLYSYYNACLAIAIFHYSASLLFCMGMTTIQLRLRTWFGHRCGLECLLAVPGIAEPAFAARDTALTIMTTSLEMLQIKPFSSKRYPSDLVRHLYIP